MATRHSTLVTLAAVTCTAALTLVGCGGGGGGSSLAAFCKDGETLGAQLDSLNSFNPLDPTSLSKLKDAASAMKKVASDAPTAEVKRDAETVADNLSTMAKGDDPPDSESTVQAAADRIDAYGSSHCNGDNAAAGSNATESFCKAVAVAPNNVDMRDWQLMKFQPALDSFDPAQPMHPNLDMVKSFATYLQKLENEAPANLEADLKTWADFADSMANGASQSSLAAKYDAAKAAATRVQSTMDNDEALCP